MTGGARLPVLFTLYTRKSLLMADSPRDSDAPEVPERRIEQTDHLNKSLLEAFKAHLDKGTVDVPENDAFDDSLDSDEEDAWNSAPMMTSEERIVFVSAMRGMLADASAPSSTSPLPSDAGSS